MDEKRCEDCGSWEKLSRYDNYYGTCTSLNVGEQVLKNDFTSRLDFGCIHWQQREPDLREQLAAYAHEAWSGWMEYMFGQTINQAFNAETVPGEFVDRWKRQSTTKYGCLPESEKQSDRAEADKMIAIFERWQKGKENGEG